MGFSEDMINSNRQNRALRSSRSTFKSRKSDIFQDVYKTRSYDKKEIEEERLQLKEKIRRDRKYKIILLLILLSTISMLMISMLS